MTCHCLLVPVTAMLLLFTVPLLSVLVSANPFHKYPYVFLLDIGNEELEKTNTEQIRLSIPGGSLAVRYPAIGDGDTIAHVRVSGIDFGNDLKAAIYDGGPGDKFVVIVFKGNPGVPYDAVVTLQTVPSDDTNDVNGQATVDSSGENNLQDSETVSSKGNAYQGEDPNDSSEDTSDLVNRYSKKTNEELIQSSPSQYNYAINEPSDKNTHKDYQTSRSERNQNVDVKDYIEEVDNNGENGDEDVNDYENEVDNDCETEKSDSNDTDDKVVQKEDGEEVRIVDSNLYDKYEALRPHLYNNVKVYPQGSVHDKQAQESEGQSGYEDDPIEMDQLFNDEEIHNNADKNKDSNNNYYDTDDSSAVAS